MPLTDANKSDLLLVVVTLLAGLSWMFSKEAVLLMPPLLFMAMRFLLAGSILLITAYRYLPRMTPELVWRSARVGFVFGSAMSCWIMGLFFATNVGEGAFLTSLGVVIVPVIARQGGPAGKHLVCYPRRRWRAGPPLTEKRLSP